MYLAQTASMQLKTKVTERMNRWCMKMSVADQKIVYKSNYFKIPYELLGKP